MNTLKYNVSSIRIDDIGAVYDTEIVELIRNNWVVTGRILYSYIDDEVSYNKLVPLLHQSTNIVCCNMNNPKIDNPWRKRIVDVLKDCEKKDNVKIEWVNFDQ